ncbi:MAG: DMT family transporter, partial [Rhizobacter sp.]
MPSHLSSTAVGPARSDAIPLLCAALAAASFISMDSVIKLMALRFDALQLGFFRFSGGSVFAVALWLWKRSPLPSRDAWRLHLVRSALLLCSLLGYFFALTQLPLVQAVTISYLAPIFVAVLAIPVLKERPAGSIWLALAAGLGGVLISMLPELRASLSGTQDTHLLGMASAAAAAVSFAGVMLLARHQSGVDSIWTILLIQSVLPLLLLAAPAFWRWQAIQTSDIALILLAGGLGTLGLLFLTYAFTRLEASRVAPLEYSGLVWATLLGY